MQQNSSILIRQHSAIAHPIRPRAIVFHRILLDRRHDLGSAEKQSMAWISFEPIALPPGFFIFNQRERRHADFTRRYPAERKSIRLQRFAGFPGGKSTNG